MIFTLYRLLIYFLRSYPVQSVCVECVAVLLPICVSLRLETDLTNGKDVALLFSFSMTHLQKRKSRFSVTLKVSE